MFRCCSSEDSKETHFKKQHVTKTALPVTFSCQRYFSVHCLALAYLICFIISPHAFYLSAQYIRKTRVYLEGTGCNDVVHLRTTICRHGLSYGKSDEPEQWGLRRQEKVLSRRIYCSSMHQAESNMTTAQQVKRYKLWLFLWTRVFIRSSFCYQTFSAFVLFSFGRPVDVQFGVLRRLRKRNVLTLPQQNLLFKGAPICDFQLIRLQEKQILN